jgi:hypothetical protein
MTWRGRHHQISPGGEWAGAILTRSAADLAKCDPEVLQWAMGENPRDDGGVDGSDGRATSQSVLVASGEVGLNVNRFLAILHFVFF